MVQAQDVKYPQTRNDNVVDEYFGEKVADPYRWLENDTSRETAQWVEAENAVTRKYIDRIPLRKSILKRLKETANYEKIGMPFEQHGKWYVYRNNGLQNQFVLYQMDSPDAKEEQQRVWLDPNTLSADGTVALKGTHFSHDGRYMAYVISRNGSDWEEIYVKDCQTGKVLDDHIVWRSLRAPNGSATDSIIAHTMLLRRERKHRLRTLCRRFITTRSVRRRAKTAYSIRIPRSRCASIA